MEKSPLLSRIMNSIDIFASKIQMTIFQKQQNSSLLSQVLTIFVALATIMILKDDLYNSFSQSSPQVLNIQQSSQDPPVKIIYRLEPHNFTYAFLVTNIQMQTNHGIDKYFQFILTLCHRHRNGEQAPTNNCSIIPLEECSLSKHFQTQTQYDYFKLYNFTSMRCIKYEWWTQNQLLIGGTFSSKDYYYLKLQLSICKNTTNATKCSPMEEIDKNLQNAFFVSYISTNQVDHSLKGDPYQIKIKSQYTTISQVFQKTQTITCSAYKTLTDVGYVSNQIEENNAILITDTKEFSDQISTNLIMFNQMILLNDGIQIALRQYDKLAKIIGQIGGLYSVLYQIISVIGSPFILAGLKLDLVNWITKKNNQIINQSNDPKSYLKTKYNEIKDILKIIRKVQIENQNNLEIVTKHMDFNYIMEKLLEIDKIKIILFDDRLHILFDSLPLINQNIQKITEQKQQFLVNHRYLNEKISKICYNNCQFMIEKSNKIGQENDSFLENMQEGQIQMMSSISKIGSKRHDSGRSPQNLHSDAIFLEQQITPSNKPQDI